MRLDGNAGRKNVAKNRHLHGHHCTTLSGYIFAFATKARIDNRKKNLLSSDIILQSTCSHNMVNFGLLTAEIHPVV